jgi:glycosyltransferase involved in cell wall biosynthesis
MIKVVHLQQSVISAGSAAYRLHKTFLNNNIDSSILSLLPTGSNDPALKQLHRRNNLIAEWDQKIQWHFIRKDVDPAYGLFSYPIFGNNVSKLPQVQNADIIIVHWVLHGFLNIHNIGQLIKLGKPIIFYLHDMWTLTGGCHYSFGCDKFMTRCNNCPIFIRKTRVDWVASEFDKKMKLFSAYNNMILVSPSMWLYECAKKSALTKGKPAFYIPNILDTTTYKPFDKKTAKKILNIDPDETVIAFGAVSVTSPYKGWAYLQKALEKLKNNSDLKNISVLIFGSDHNQQIADSIPFKTRFMGYLKDEYSTTLVYNAADVFVAPSLAEAFGYTIYEALSCGTPVVAFDTGGIPDQIMHKENGYLAKYKDSEDIAQGIEFCLNNKIQGYALPDFATDVSVKKYLELFDQITSGAL